MQVTYGNYNHASNESAVVVQRTGVYGHGGYRIGYKESWHITGFLQADTQSALKSACDALDTAYLLDGQDLTLVLNGGGAARVLTSANSFTGTMVKEGPSYPESGADSAEFSTFRRYSIVVEAEYRLAQNNLISWIETISSTGTGGPRFIFKQTQTGLPQKQIVAQATPCMATQRGSAIGMYSHETPPPPLWPDAEHQDQRFIDFKTPKRSGPVLNPIFTEYETTWQYSFSDTSPLQSFPNKWPAGNLVQ